VRTSIAVMAFRIPSKKDELFLEFGAPALAGRTLSLPGQKFGNIAGVAFIILGTVMVCIAAARFCDDRQEYSPRRPAPGNRIANRHLICGFAGPSGLRSIPFDARPSNEALTDFRKRFN
jgi:hypothetical protein